MNPKYRIGDKVCIPLKGKGYKTIRGRWNKSYFEQTNGELELTGIRIEEKDYKIRRFSGISIKKISSKLEIEIEVNSFLNKKSNKKIK